MNSINYIRNWFLSNNSYIKNDKNKENILHILTFYTIVFAKFHNLNNDDEIILNNRIINYCGGVTKESEEFTRILNIINLKYGYLEYEDLVNTSGYKKIKNSNLEGTLSMQDLVDYLYTIFSNVMQEYKNYDFNKVVYRINGKVFICDKTLTEIEFAKLYKISDTEQKIFEVYHSKDRVIIY